MTKFRAALAIVFASAALLFSLLVPASDTHAATTTVVAGDIFFCSESFRNGVCVTTVTAGDTIVWDFSGADIAHTVTDCGASCSNPTSSPRFDSGIVQGGGASFQFVFSNPGTYNYYCQVHAFEMQGQVVVQAGAAPTVPGSTPTTSGATLVPGTTPPSSGGLPATGSGPKTSGSSEWLAMTLLAATGLAAISLAGLIGVRLAASRQER